MAPPAATEASAPLRPEALLAACPQLTEAPAAWVAFSGGLDSTVLLHLAAALRDSGALSAPLSALHVNHGLQPAATAWETHCASVCAALRVPLRVLRVQVEDAPGLSVEEAARKARHAAFAATLEPGAVLMLAQHRDDQAETVLFRLLRGSGPAGMAGIPAARSCGAGLLLRPLLEQARAQLEAYARTHELHWVEDPSNADLGYDRNFLRREILALLRQRWPGIDTGLLRSARLATEAAGLLDALASADLAAARRPGTAACLDATVLSGLAPERRRNLLRYWLTQLHREQGLALPNHQVLEHVESEVLFAAPDATPLLAWGKGEARTELRRFRGTLYALRPLPPLPTERHWDIGHALELGAGLGSLSLQPCQIGAVGLSRSRVSRLTVRFRAGGEAVKAAGRPSRPLKKLLQESGIPPWLRAYVPLLYAGDELVAVADLLVCEGWQAKPGEDCRQVVWQRPTPDCGY